MDVTFIVEAPTGWVIDYISNAVPHLTTTQPFGSLAEAARYAEILDRHSTVVAIRRIGELPKLDMKV